MGSTREDRRELSHFLQRVFDLVNEEIDKNHGNSETRVHSEFSKPCFHICGKFRGLIRPSPCFLRFVSASLGSE